jgi:hypothetical protein
MKRLLFIFLGFATLYSCSPKMEGMTEVKGPFIGNKYEGNNRWFRGVGSGESMNLETSKDKALLSAKQRLASSLQTQIKTVSEEYKGERQADAAIGDFNDRFQSITREVMSQILVEVQTIDTKTYQKKDKNYVTYVALEARKKTVYKKLKEIALQKQSLSDKDKKYIQEMMDKTIKDLNDDGE